MMSSSSGKRKGESEGKRTREAINVIRLADHPQVHHLRAKEGPIASHEPRARDEADSPGRIGTASGL